MAAAFGRLVLVRNPCSCYATRTVSSTASLSRLKSEWRKDKQPANTKLSDENIIEPRRVYGGSQKFKAVNIRSGNYSLESEGLSKKFEILDVVHSDAGKHLREQKIMVKNGYLLLDASPIKDEINVEKLFQSLESKTPDEVKNHVNSLLENNKIYAKITSRPGQVGNCDGIIVEGNELVHLYEKLKIYASEM